MFGNSWHVISLKFVGGGVVYWMVAMRMMMMTTMRQVW